MCNGWNHDPDCPCRFGGETNSRCAYGRDTSHFTSYESYVNPFAKCPVCGASVFFFHATNGGRVFFDDLGPPWPKHPCTDHSSDRFPVAFDRHLRRAPGTDPSWQKEGWSPFLLKSTYPRPSQRIYEVWGAIIPERERRHISIFIHKEWFRRANDWADQWEPTDPTPTFVRRTDDGYELSGITLKGGQLREHFLKGQIWF